MFPSKPSDEATQDQNYVTVFFLKSIDFVHYQNHPFIKTPPLFRVDTTVLFSQAAIDFCDSTREKKRLKEKLLYVRIIPVVGMVKCTN